MKETALFDPVATHFLDNGYEVAAEVCHCDIVAHKDGELVIIELKKSLNLSVITQAVARQSITSAVYIAVTELVRGRNRRRVHERILKRLGLGLITVSLTPLRSLAEIRVRPEHQGRINQRKKKAVIKELAGRSIQPNVGGSTGMTIYTAYRETAITIAHLLAIRGPTQLKDIRAVAGEKSPSILTRNHYGWYERVSRGVYQLTPVGHAALDEYPEMRALASRLIHPK